MPFLTVVFIGFFKLIDWHAEHMALALASSGSALVNAGMLYFYLHKRNIFRFGAHWKKLVIQFAIANAVMIAALWYGLTWYNGDVIYVDACRGSDHLMCDWYCCLWIALIATGFRPRHLKP